MAQNKSVQQASEFAQLFTEGKTKVSISALQNYFDKKSLNYKIQVGIVDSISKQTLNAWKNKTGQVQTNKLLAMQLYEQLSEKLKDDVKTDQQIKQTNQKLKKINGKTVQLTIFKQAMNEKKQTHIYTFYSSMVKAKQAQQTKKQDNPNQQNSTSLTVRQQEQVQKQIKSEEIKQNDNKKDNNTQVNKNIQGDNEKNEKKKQVNANTQSSTKEGKSEQKMPTQKQAHKSQANQKNKDNKSNEVKPKQLKNANTILHEYMKLQSISKQQIGIIEQQIKVQCSQQLLKQFKNTRPNKAMDNSQSDIGTLYKNWIGDKHKTEQQKKTNKDSQNVAKDSQKINKDSQKAPHNIQSKQKSGKQKKQVEDAKIQTKELKEQGHSNKANILTFVNKYLKKSKQQKIANKVYQNFNLNLKHEASQQLENKLDFSVNIMIGAKQVTKLQNELQAKKLVSEKQSNEYIIIKIRTKKAEQIQQNIELKAKEGELKLEGVELKTFTNDRNIYISFKFVNQNANSVLNQIHNVICQLNEDNHCKIQLKTKVGLGNAGKQRPQDRKFIKCLARGFDISFQVSGSNQVNYRFRKNLQIENKQSKLYGLLALTKNSCLKLRWKKISDLNSLLNKLGIIQAVKETPSIKQLFNDSVKQVFGIGVPSDLIVSHIILSILDKFETNKLSIMRFNQSAAIQMSLDFTDAKKLITK